MTKSGRAGPKLFAQARGPIRGAVVASWARALLGAGAALVLGEIVDRTVGGDPVTGQVAVLVGLLAGRGLLGAAGPMLAATAANGVVDDVRARVLDAALATVPAADRRSGDVVTRATEGVEAVGALAGTFLPPLVGGITIPVLLIGVVATVDWRTALVLAVVVPMVPGLLRFMERRFASVSTRYRETADRLAARFLDGIQGLRTLKALGRAGDYGDRLAADSERLRADTMALLRVNQLALLAVDSLFTLGTVVAAAGMAAWRASAGAVSVGEAVAIVLLGAMLIEPLTGIGRFFYVGAIGRAAAKQVGELLAAAPRPAVAPDIGGPAPEGVPPGAVVLDQVRVSYPDGPVALDTISLRVEPGERVALVGPSGAGKSTLAKLVVGLLTPDAGTVRVGGRAVLVSQRPFLFHGTVADNLRLAAPGATDDELWAALAAVDLADRFEGRPARLGTLVGERGLRLSGGEAQRLAIARALLVDAAVVVLDEPTSNVDLDTEAHIRRALDRLTEARTVLVIAHRRSTVAGADRTVRLEAGRVATGAGT